MWQSEKTTRQQANTHISEIIHEILVEDERGNSKWEKKIRLFRLSYSSFLLIYYYFIFLLKNIRIPTHKWIFERSLTHTNGEWKNYSISLCCALLISFSRSCGSSSRLLLYVLSQTHTHIHKKWWQTLKILLGGLRTFFKVSHARRRKIIPSFIVLYDHRENIWFFICWNYPNLMVVSEGWNFMPSLHTWMCLDIDIDSKKSKIHGNLYWNLMLLLCVPPFITIWSVF